MLKSFNIVSDLNDKAMIKKETAQKIASYWHGGQWSQLYAFCSSGGIETENSLLLVEEIIQEQLRPEVSLKPFNRSKKDIKQLADLRAFVLNMLDVEYGVKITIEKDFYGNDLPVLFATSHNVRQIKRIQ